MAVTNQRLIDQYARIHEAQEYGQSAHNYVLLVQVCLLDLKPRSVLEYGCGQSNLYEKLQWDDGEWFRYDPAIPAYSTVPVDRVDFVVNTDVMEHIPEEDVPDVLAHIRSLSDKVFFYIATRPATQLLPNGENAHCTVWSSERWLSEIRKHFPDSQLAFSRASHSCIIVTWASPVGQVLRGIEGLRQDSLRYTAGLLLSRVTRTLRRAQNALSGG
jgi:hypothetical protein